jgi:hypothetical protein
MSIKPILYTLTLLLVYNSTLAQPSFIKGRVVDTNDSGLANVTIFDNNSNAGKTDINGAFTLKGYQGGTDVKLRFEKDGYYPSKDTSFAVSSNGSNLRDIVLKRNLTVKTIVGYIIDGSTYKPITGATVQVVTASSLWSKSDTDGYYSIPVSRPSLTNQPTVRVMVYADGFNRVDSRSVSFDSLITINLSPIISPPLIDTTTIIKDPIVVPIVPEYSWQIQYKLGFNTENPNRYVTSLSMAYQWKGISAGIALSLFKSYSSVVYHQLPGVAPIVKESAFNQFPVGVVFGYEPQVKWSVIPSFQMNLGLRAQQYLFQATATIWTRVCPAVFFGYANLGVKSQESEFNYTGSSNITNVYSTQQFLMAGLGLVYKFNL